jgi:hypothetical protein
MQFNKRRNDHVCRHILTTAILFQMNILGDPAQNKGSDSKSEIIVASTWHCRENLARGMVVNDHLCDGTMV